jgi:hypothetical protein
LNWYSIGIEMDNAGKLIDGSNRVYAKRGNVTIPESQYQRVRHWRDYYAKPWHTFPEIQLKVVFKVLKALESYFRPIQELLEHERVSLLTRTDPGPLFPMDQLRLEVLGRAEPVFERYRVVRDTALYENSYYQAPKEEYGQHPKTKSECIVKEVFKECNYWVKIEIVKYQKPNWIGRKGWLRKGDVTPKNGKLYLTPKCDFYTDPDDKIRPPCLPMYSLPTNTEVRIQKTVSNKWSLVATPDHKPGFKFLEGWVRKADLELVQA